MGRGVHMGVHLCTDGKGSVRRYLMTRYIYQETNIVETETTPTEGASEKEEW